MLNYEECWEDLRSELRQLSDRKVRAIDPEIVLAYMRFIEQQAENRPVLSQS